MAKRSDKEVPDILFQEEINKKDYK